jgi:hypothetical protein
MSKPYRSPSCAPRYCSPPLGGRCAPRICADCHQSERSTTSCPSSKKVLATPPDPGYVEYLTGKLHPFAQRKAEAVPSRLSESFTS